MRVVGCRNGYRTVINQTTEVLLCIVQHIIEVTVMIMGIRCKYFIINCKAATRHEDIKT